MDYSGFIDLDAETGIVKAIEATIKTASVNTVHEKSDIHLKNPDFFDVEKYPTMSYKMKGYQKTDEGYTAMGDLTLRDVTKEITLRGNFNGTTKDPWGAVTIFRDRRSSSMPSSALFPSRVWDRPARM